MTERIIRTAASLLLASAAVASAGAGPAAAQPDGRRPLPMDERVVTGRLENGLRYYVRANREPPNRAELRLVVNAGSVLESPDQLGVAHFLEHMAFNGTRNFPKQELVRYLESLGMRFGPDVNAYTSFDETVYMLSLPTDTAGVLETGVRILEDWASGITLDSLEVERERAVVIEEWRLRQSAGSRMQKQQFPVLMGRSRYAHRDPIGTLESLRTFRLSSVRRFHRDWYRPDLMAVVAVGDFDAEQMEALIRERFSTIPAPRRPRKRPEYRVPEHRETLVSVASDDEATSSTVNMYLKRRPRAWRTVADYRDWLIESLASSMLTNRLSELTQRPAAPFIDVSSFQGRFVRPLSAHVVSVRAVDGEVERATGALLREAERAARHGFAATELEREKRETMRLMEQRFVERANTTSGSFASDYVSHFLYGGTPMDLAAEYGLYEELLPTITAREVNSRARTWRSPRDRVVLIRGPKRPDSPLPSVRTVQRLIAEARTEALEPYSDGMAAGPLMSQAPPPGSISAEREIPAIGALEWTLSNGARVLLKQTDFRDDEILVAARSPGGSSLVEDEDFVHALTAAAVVQSGGLGELSSIELRKLLAGKVAGIGADIGEGYEGLSGAASTRDVETLFQLIHLRFTAPRVDTTAFLAYRDQARAALANRAASPELVFFDSVRATLTQNHPRARPTTPAMFDSLDLHRSFAIYRDRFADASDFTFYLVGTFDPDTIRPLVERYLASLPSLGRVETGRDLGIRPPAGVVRRTVYKGVEPKALTHLVFNGPFDFTRENLYELSALAELLRIRLREVLREEEGGTYGVEVAASGSPEPRSRYNVSIRFGADPERLDQLTRLVFAQLDSLRTFGPQSVDVVRVREVQLRGRELDLRQNQFWIAQIMNFDRFDWGLERIGEYQPWVAALTAPDLQRFAGRYLDADNYVQVSLLPERYRPRRAGAAEPEPAAGPGVSPRSVEETGSHP